jgi:hypothetical protein
MLLSSTPVPRISILLDNLNLISNSKFVLGHICQLSIIAIKSSDRMHNLTNDRQKSESPVQTEVNILNGDGEEF